MNQRQGFTLIEVMISMVIMSFLTVLISSSIRSAVHNKQKLEARIATETLLYDVLRVIKLDVERAFHYQDVFFQIENLALQQLEAEKSKAKTPNGGVAQQQNNLSQQRRPPKKLTHFIGTSENMHFTSLNHFRTKYNAQESNQMEVGYFVDSCAKQSGKGSSNCLWRRSTPEIDDNVEEGGSKVVLAEDVNTFKLLYRSNEENDEWVKEWRSDNKGRGDHANRFPHFVKVELSIGDKKNRKAKVVQQTVVIQIQFPNNESHLSQQNGQPGQPGAGQQQGLTQ